MIDISRLRFSQAWLLILALVVGFTASFQSTDLAGLPTEPVESVQLLLPLPSRLCPLGHECREAREGSRAVTVLAVAKRFVLLIPEGLALSPESDSSLIRPVADQATVVTGCRRSWTSRAPPLA